MTFYTTVLMSSFEFEFEFSFESRHHNKLNKENNRKIHKIFEQAPTHDISTC